MGRQNKREAGRLKRKLRIRQRIFGTAKRPRLCVFKSAKHIYVQLIDDVKGNTLASASTLDKELKGKVKDSLQGAKAIGQCLAKRARQKGIQQVLFDRAGFRYHGKLKALADAVREEGIAF